MTTPTNISQYAEVDEHIAWHDDFSPLTAINGNNGVYTVKPLYHISRSPKYDLTNKTWYIQATGFTFENLPETISGITASIKIERGGRITDDTVQICYQGQLISENKAASIMDPRSHRTLLDTVTVYGGATDTWKIENLSLAMVQDSSFGIVIRYQSHPHWPHKTSPIIRAVELAIS
jgi:hypothetical protein